jgi:hypothetical protein
MEVTESVPYNTETKSKANYETATGITQCSTTIRIIKLGVFASSTAYFKRSTMLM